MLAPVASSLTKDAPNSGRVSTMIVPLTILIGLRANFIYRTLKNNKHKLAFFFILGGFLFFSLINFYQVYFKTFPQMQAKYWGAGYKQLVTFLNQEQYRKKAVIMERPTYSPYIYFLFYGKYDPEKYQQETQRYQPDEEGFVHVKSFDRFTFRNFDLNEELKTEQLVIIFGEKFSPKLLTIITDFNQTVFTIFGK
jgi:hypothetical protein